MEGNGFNSFLLDCLPPRAIKKMIQEKKYLEDYYKPENNDERAQDLLDVVIEAEIDHLDILREGQSGGHKKEDMIENEVNRIIEESHE